MKELKFLCSYKPKEGFFGPKNLRLKERVVSDMVSSEQLCVIEN